MYPFHVSVDAYGDAGISVQFPYDGEMVRRIRMCLGLRWNKTTKSWVSDGPDVWLDLERFAIAYRMSPAAAERRDAYWAQLQSIVTLQRTPLPGGLYTYQRRGSDLMRLQESGILADDMGLGKSKQAIEAARAAGCRDILVVAPKTLIYNWLEEFEKWWPEIPIQVGPKPDTTAGGVIITNYERLIRGGGIPMSTRFDALILDEAQRVKNPSTQTHKAVYKLAKNAEYVWALTGTPLEMRVEELYGIMSVCRPAVFGNWMRFRDQHIVLDYWKRPKGVKNLTTLKERVAPWMTRRAKADVASHLPPKLYTEAYVDLTDAERRAYDAISGNFEGWMRANAVQTAKLDNSITELAELIRFQQFTSSPYLLGEDVGAELGRGSKWDALRALVDDWQGRVLVFSRFSEMVNLMRAWTPPALHHADAWITGALGSARERQARIRAFNAGELGKVFYATDAAAFGLNVTGADLIIHYDKLWNPAKEWQREDRLHRIGQDKAVNVVHMLCRDTLDVGMHEVTKRRGELFHEVIDGARDVFEADARPSLINLIRGGALI